MIVAVAALVTVLIFFAARLYATRRPPGAEAKYLDPLVLAGIVNVAIAVSLVALVGSVALLGVGIGLVLVAVGWRWSPGP